MNLVVAYEAPNVLPTNVYVHKEPLHLVWRLLRLLADKFEENPKAFRLNDDCWV
jgi:hypothetical protein